MQAVKEKWTANSRLFSKGKLPDGREEFALDVGIGPINYHDGVEFQEIDLTPVASDDPQFDWMIDKAPYKLYLGADGSRRIFPDRNDTTRFVEFDPPTQMAGKTLTRQGELWKAAGGNLDFEVKAENSRVVFDLVAHAGPVPSVIEFPYRAQGITDQEILAYIGSRFAFERGNDALDAPRREIAFSVANGKIRLEVDTSGMAFPVVIDPTLDLQVGASGDDVRHNDSHTINQDIFAAGRSSFNMQSACRFTGVTIPQGATIDVAYLIFTPDVASTGSGTNTNLQAHDADASPQVTDDTEWHAAVDSNLTTALVAWDDISDWADDVEEQSPSIVSIIQELVDRAGWNEVAHIFWLNDASATSKFRRAHQHDDDSGKAVKLHIEYTAGGVDVAVPLGTFSLAEQVPSIETGVTVAPPLGTFSLAGFAPTISTSSGVAIAVPLGTFSLAGQVPSIETGVSAAPPLGTYSLAGFAPTISTSSGVDIAVPLGTFSLSGQVPGVGTGVILEAPLGTFSLAGQVPAVGTGVKVDTPLGTFALVGLAVTIGTGAKVDSPLGSFSLTGFAPAVASGAAVALPLGTFALAGFAPSVEGAAGEALFADVSLVPTLDAGVVLRPSLEGAPALNTLLSGNARAGS